LFDGVELCTQPRVRSNAKIHWEDSQPGIWLGYRRTKKCNWEIVAIYLIALKSDIAETGSIFLGKNHSYTENMGLLVYLGTCYSKFVRARYSRHVFTQPVHTKAPDLLYGI
jgi:hypothetical protein